MMGFVHVKIEYMIVLLGSSPCNCDQIECLFFIGRMAVMKTATEINVAEYMILEGLMKTCT